MATRVKYRTLDGEQDYGFSFETQSDGSYRAYITDMPSYGNRDTRLVTTHRLKEEDRYYVCWTQPLYNQEDLSKVVALWADSTQEYIKTGRTIDEQMRG